MDELNKEYAKLMAEYEDHVQKAIASEDIKPHADKLKSLNTQIADVLDKMIQITAQSKEVQATDYRTDLLQKLDKIQKDYNGLSQKTDQIETLRRIRANQTVDTNFNLYFFLFLAICVLLILLIFFRGQNSDSVTSMANRPAAMPAFT
jgi:hypothetical protein